MAYKLWLFLVFVRFLWVFQPQAGYIHPDEFFQNPEPLAGDMFGYDVHRTWEFNKTQLSRSLFFPTLTSGIPFLILKSLSEVDLVQITPATLLIFPRLAMVIFSLSTDFCIYNISKLLGFNAKKCLNVFASSYIVLVFCSRTFSNPIEMGVFALILLMVVDSRQYQLAPQASIKTTKDPEKKTKDKEKNTKEQETKKGGKKGKGQGIVKEKKEAKETATKLSRKEITQLRRKNISAGFWLGIFILEGFFNRVTLGLYALFPLLFWLTGSATSFSFSAILTIVKNGLLIVPGFLVHLILHLVLDSLYAETLDHRFFRDMDFAVKNLNFDLLSNITLTPLNLIRYNLDHGNLETHGIHPRVTHFFFNLPLLCLPLFISFVMEVFSVYFKGKSARPNFTNSSCRAFLGLCFFTPVLLISVFPHQEARYVIPAVIPLILLYSEYVTLPSGFPNAPWIVWNLMGSLVFGVLHQGGMLPCLTHINGMLTEPAHDKPVSYHMVFYHTYMPPRHLLMWTKPPHVDKKGEVSHMLHIHDMMGSERMTLLRKVDELMDPKTPIPKPYRREVYVIAPASLDPIFCRKNIKNNYKLVKTFSPHLSMEDPPILFPSYTCVEEKERSPARMSQIDKLKFSFSLNLYKVERVIHVQTSFKA